DTPIGEITAFMTEPGAVLISTDVAERFGLEMGDALTLEVTGRERQVFVAGLLEPSDDLSRRSLNGLILADVATAQEVLARPGVLDRIDVLRSEEHTSELQSREK